MFLLDSINTYNYPIKDRRGQAGRSGMFTLEEVASSPGMTATQIRPQLLSLTSVAIQEKLICARFDLKIRQI